MPRNILVTSALPYANGPIHLGHLVEAIQTDIWVRYQKLRGNNCHYMCADDTHGTAIMISAKKAGITPEALIKVMYDSHLKDYQDFLIDFDHYYTTHSDENRQLASKIYLKAKEKGLIYEREINQLYCNTCQMFLPDRYIKGTCPRCNTANQYGDSCESCSATYSPDALIQPFCTECKSTPVLKKSVHHFFKLSAMTDEVKKWVDEDHIRPEIKNKLEEWFKSGIKDWDISRDAPYFGFQIPGTSNKYFYVWLDAPIGYIATTKNWCEKTNTNFDNIWHNPDYEIHHFIGKDILYFHTLFWPAMLMAANFTLPKQVHVHGFLTVNGTKMSKSRGTFILARTYLEQLNPEYLRYYFASKLSYGIEDIDLNLEDFVNKVNAEVVNKVINIGSRLGAILNKKLNGKFTSPDPEGLQLLNIIHSQKTIIESAYENLETNKAIRTIIELAEQANRYIDEQKPWDLAIQNPEKATAVCTTGLNIFKHLITFLKPVLPQIADRAATFLNTSSLTWSDLDTNLTDHGINPYEHLAARLDLKAVQKQLQKI